MTGTQIIEFILGQGGVTVALCIALYHIWKERNELRAELNRINEERLKDANDTKVLAQALLASREQGQGER